MTPSPFLIQLAILLLPGVIWAALDARFAQKAKLSQIQFVLRSLFFGLASYVVTYGAYTLFGEPFEIVDITKVDGALVLNRAVLTQIAVATIVGFLLALAWLRSARERWLPRALQALKVTNSYGDEDVWDFLLNSSDKASYFVNIRDFEKQLTYAGWVSTFSQSEKMREIVLLDVRVYNFDGDLLFETPRVYLSLKSEGIHMEFPYTGEPLNGVAA